MRFALLMDTRVKPAYDDRVSFRLELFREHENLARARHVGPAAVEFGDQRLERVPARGAIERGLIGEFISRLMQRGIADTPEPPRLRGAERLYGIGKMLALIPLIERLAFCRIGDRGANDEIG